MSRKVESETVSERRTGSSSPAEPLVLTPEELARALGISRAHLFRLHSRGSLVPPRQPRLVPRPLGDFAQADTT